MTTPDIDTLEVKELLERGRPPQNNYEKIIDELFWMRRELEELRGVIFDHTVIIARWANALEMAEHNEIVVVEAPPPPLLSDIHDGSYPTG